MALRALGAGITPASQGQGERNQVAPLDQCVVRDEHQPEGRQ